jgi:hypothetical protein
MLESAQYSLETIGLWLRFSAIRSLGLSLGEHSIWAPKALRRRVDDAVLAFSPSSGFSSIFQGPSPKPVVSKVENFVHCSTVILIRSGYCSPFLSRRMSL